MDIRLIALDLDGTLLDSQKRLSSRNRQALTECLERGIHIVPTTGRTVSGIPSVVRELPGVRYAITTNGAVVGYERRSNTVGVYHSMGVGAEDIKNY